MYSQLDGRYHAFLLTVLVKPKALAIDPVEGYFTTYRATFCFSLSSAIFTEAYPELSFCHRPCFVLQEGWLPPTKRASAAKIN